MLQTRKMTSAPFRLEQSSDGANDTSNTEAAEPETSGSTVAARTRASGA